MVVASAANPISSTTTSAKDSAKDLYYQSLKYAVVPPSSQSTTMTIPLKKEKEKEKENLEIEMEEGGGGEEDLEIPMVITRHLSSKSNKNVKAIVLDPLGGGGVVHRLD